MINSSFVVYGINGKFLFLKRNDNGKWDLPGGAVEKDETDHKGVAIREAEEEAGITIKGNQIHLCATLGQKLKAAVSAQYGGLKNGLVFIHYCITYGAVPAINPGNEHSDWQLFSYEEIISSYKEFSSGPLWMFFTFLAFQQQNNVQEGTLYERRIWQGDEYL